MEAPQARPSSKPSQPACHLELPGPVHHGGKQSFSRRRRVRRRFLLARSLATSTELTERQDLEVSRLHRLPAAIVPDAKCRTRVDKVNAELVTLTYGTIVAQLCKDFESDYAEVNRQLDKMGYNIGLRLIEDYLAKSNTMKRCSNFRETADMIARVRARSARRCGFR